MDSLTDAAFVALVPGLVEIAKRAGLPGRFAGLAAIVLGITVVALRGLAMDAPSIHSLPAWLLDGVVVGLAASGLYSQGKNLGPGSTDGAPVEQA